MPGSPLVFTVVGNRPQFVKAAAVSGPLRELATEFLVHTGQHHDPELSDVFFEELGIPKPDAHLGISGGSDSGQVDRMVERLMPLIEEQSPDWVLVYGDTNSTLAGAVAAERLAVRVAHVEAGMRSFDQSMPEERNRIATDRLSDLLLCSTPTAVGNLEQEGLPGRVELVGDVMADVAAMVTPKLRGSTKLLERFGLRQGEYLLATAHRAGNVDAADRLEKLVEVFESLSMPTILPLHPRTSARLVEHGLADRLKAIESLITTGPLGYLDFQTLLVSSAALLTDSGGAQKEAYLAGVKCVTLRATTEWVETVDAGWNTLVDLDKIAVREALASQVPDARPDLYGDARAAQRVVASLIVSST